MMEATRTPTMYVTMIRGSRVAVLDGPYDTEPEAREHVRAARTWANERDGFTEFDAFGVTSIPNLGPLPLMRRAA